MHQWEINELLVAKGKEGKIVARLKGGDPLVFGRGGEEAMALREAGVPFEFCTWCYIAYRSACLCWYSCNTTRYGYILLRLLLVMKTQQKRCLASIGKVLPQQWIPFALSWA